MAEKRRGKPSDPGNPADRLGDTTKSHGPLGQGSSDVLSASQNLSGTGKSQAPAGGTGNATSSASPSGPRPLQEQREAGSFGPDGVQRGVDAGPTLREDKTQAPSSEKKDRRPTEGTP